MSENLSKMEMNVRARIKFSLTLFKEQYRRSKSEILATFVNKQEEKKPEVQRHVDLSQLKK